MRMNVTYGCLMYAYMYVATPVVHQCNYVQEFDF